MEYSNYILPDNGTQNRARQLIFINVMNIYKISGFQIAIQCIYGVVVTTQNGGERLRTWHNTGCLQISEGPFKTIQDLLFENIRRVCI